MKRFKVAMALLAGLALAGCWNPFRGGGGRRPAANVEKTTRASVPIPREMKLKSLWDLPIAKGAVKKAWVSQDYAMVITENPHQLYLVRLYDGFTIWVCETELPIETAYAPQLSPDAVMIVTENRILRVDRDYGELITVLSPSLPISARPILGTWVETANNIPVIYAPSHDGRIWSLNIRKLPGQVPGPTPGDPPIKYTRYVTSRGWSTRTPHGKGHLLAPLTFNSGRIYACTTNGYVMCLRDTDGTDAWGGAVQTQGHVEKGVSLSGDRAYFGSTDYKLYCVNNRSGQKIWEFPTGSMVTERPLADPAGELVVVLSEGQGLLGAETEKGRKIWQNKDAASILGIGEKAVYVTDQRGQLMALDKKTGEATWKSPMSGLRTVFPNVEQFDTGRKSLYLLALTNRNEMVCLVEPTFKPPLLITGSSKPTTPDKTDVTIIRGDGGTPAPAAP